VTATAGSKPATRGVFPSGNVTSHTTRASRDRKNFAAKVLNMVFHRTAGAQGPHTGKDRACLSLVH
jgi:hypothetical protein